MLSDNDVVQQCRGIMCSIQELNENRAQIVHGRLSEKNYSEPFFLDTFFDKTHSTIKGGLKKKKILTWKKGSVVSTILQIIHALHLENI